MKEIPFTCLRHPSWLLPGLAFLLAGAPLLSAQTLGPALEKMKRARQSAPAPFRQASRHDPARVRTMLQAVHGFSRAGMDAASTDVPAILTGFIDDPGESMLLRRQAIKALGLYPTEASFTFITGRLESAPLGLQRLYITSLGGFGHSRREDILPLLEALLANRDATVRDAALGLARHLAPGPALLGLLQARLAVEPEAGLRQAIQGQLQAQ